MSPMSTGPILGCDIFVRSREWFLTHWWCVLTPVVSICSVLVRHKDRNRQNTQSRSEVPSRSLILNSLGDRRNVAQCLSPVPVFQYSNLHHMWTNTHKYFTLFCSPIGSIRELLTKPSNHFERLCVSRWFLSSKPGENTQMRALLFARTARLNTWSTYTNLTRLI